MISLKEPLKREDSITKVTRPSIRFQLVADKSMNSKNIETKPLYSNPDISDIICIEITDSKETENRSQDSKSLISYVENNGMLVCFGLSMVDITV